MAPLKDTISQLREIGEQPDNEVEVVETALLLAALDLPDSELAGFRKHVQDLTHDVCEAGAGVEMLEDQARVLAQVIGEVYGYDGEQRDFDNPLNANLISVIERRSGLPVTLGLLYVHAGRAAGWCVNGLNFPGHFLVCLGEGDGMVVLDPFQSGRLLTEQDLQGFLQRIRGANARLKASDLGFMSNRAILIRLLANIKQRAMGDKDETRALEILERMVMIAPRQPSVLYEYAMVNAQVGHLSLALQTLADAAQYAGDEASRRKALSSLESIKRRLN